MVERGGLENRCAFAGTQGSNPCLSANLGLAPACFAYGSPYLRTISTPMSFKRPVGKMPPAQTMT